MNIFNLFRKKKKLVSKSSTSYDELSISKKKIETKELQSITPSYSENIPPTYKTNEELEFLNYINGRFEGSLSDYHISHLNDYKALIEGFYKKGFLMYDDKKNLESFTVTDLKDILRENSLKLTGNKPDLIDRVQKNISKDCLSNHSKYKIKYILSTTGEKQLNDYLNQKNSYNDYRDDLIFKEELNKENPHKTMLVKFNDLNNTDEFKTLLSKCMLLSDLRGYAYETIIDKIISSTDEELNCPELDDFLMNGDARLSNRVRNYEDKLILYLVSKRSEANYLYYKNRCIESDNIDWIVKVIPDPSSCLCNICPTEAQSYTKEDFIKDNAPILPHHYGCMCYIITSL